MMKVIIADDEPKVNLLLQKIVNWEALGFEIVGTAQDGLRALELIRTENPDLVLTDIRMPGCDGMELIRRAKEINPEILFVVVSGYRQFEYARTALKYGVEDYLLKPIKADELTQILKQAQAKRNERQELERWKENVHQKLQKDGQRKREKLILDLKNCAAKEIEFEDFEKINEEYGCGFGEGEYQTVLIKPDIPMIQGSMDTYKIMMKRSLEIVRKHTEDFTDEAASAMEPEGIVLAFYRVEYNPVQIRQCLTKIRKEIENQRDLFWGITVTIAMGGIKKDIRELPLSAKESIWLCRERIYHGKGAWLDAEDRRILMEEKHYRMPPSRRKYLQEIGEYLDQEKLDRELAAIEEELNADSGVCGQMMYECFEEITDAVLTGIRQNEKIEEDSMRSELRQGYYMCASQKEIFEWLREYFEGVFEGYRQQKMKKELKPILEAKRYIQEHFQQPLKLEEVSRSIGFNATYFSSVFKKETGKNFSDYLTELRINKAKQLLCSGEMTVNDVAGAVGYQDLKYFSRLFKKSTGISPSDYKKLYQ